MPCRCKTCVEVQAIHELIRTRLDQGSEPIHVMEGLVVNMAELKEVVINEMMEAARATEH